MSCSSCALIRQCNPTSRGQRMHRPAEVKQITHKTPTPRTIEKRYARCYFDQGRMPNRVEDGREKECQILFAQCVTAPSLSMRSTVKRCRVIWTTMDNPAEGPGASRSRNLAGLICVGTVGITAGGRLSALRSRCHRGAGETEAAGAAVPATLLAEAAPRITQADRRDRASGDTLGQYRRPRRTSAEMSSARREHG